MNPSPSAFRGIALALVLLSIASQRLYAQHPLALWARRDVAGVTANFRGVAFGNGTFVAVGSSSTVATSADGTTWSTSTIGSYGDLLQVRFLKGQFVAVGSSDKILISDDGTSWTAGTLPSFGFWDVAYGNGTYVVAGTSAYVSTNGVDWMLTQPRITIAFPPMTRNARLDSVVFGNGIFVALTTEHDGSGSPRSSLYSTNGTDWTQGGNTPSTLTGGSGDLLFRDGLFLGTGHSYSGVPGVWASDTGISWCCGFAGEAGTGNRGVALAFGADYFLWVQQQDLLHEYPYIYSSTNGTSWTTRVSVPRPVLPNDPNLPFYQAVQGQVRGAAFGAASFVLVGENGYILQSGNLGGTPLIVRQPQDRAAVVGNPASFTVEASGSPPLGYQWFFNDVPISGATTPLLAFDQVVAANTGAYKVVITNSFGSVTSRVAQLSVSFLEIESYAGIKVVGLVGRTYRIEATPANGPVNWQTLTNLVLPSTPYVWIDYSSPAASATCACSSWRRVSRNSSVERSGF